MLLCHTLAISLMLHHLASIRPTISQLLQTFSARCLFADGLKVDVIASSRECLLFIASVARENKISLENYQLMELSLVEGNIMLFYISRDIHNETPTTLLNNMRYKY